jgi:hypothetical protein
MEREQERYSRAAILYAQSLTLFHALDDSYGAARCLDGLASVACALNAHGRAARLAGAAAALRESLGTPLPPIDRVVVEHDMARARAQLGDAAFAAAWAAGMALPVHQAISEALDGQDCIEPECDLQIPENAQGQVDTEPRDLR